MLSAVALVGAGCGNEADQSAGQPGPDCVDLRGSAAAEVVMLDNKFDPDCFTVSRDQGLTLRNEGNALHDFAVEGSDIRLDVPSGEETNTEAIGEMLQPGDAKVVCTYHPGMGARMIVK